MIPKINNSGINTLSELIARKLKATYGEVYSVLNEIMKNVPDEGIDIYDPLNYLDEGFHVVPHGNRYKVQHSKYKKDYGEYDNESHAEWDAYGKNIEDAKRHLLN